MIVRDATAADWKSVWPFFQPIVAAGDTFSYPTGLTYEEGRRTWMQEPPGRTTVVTAEDGTLVGSANMYANRGGPGAHVASGNYMVDPAHQGRGAGRALINDSIAWAREQGFRAFQFNAVAESNTPALALYHAAGFRIVGTVPEGFRHPVKGYVGLHVLYLPL